MTEGPLLLLDSASMWFRAFHGVPETITAPDGTPVNAVRGFLDAVAQLVVKRRPSRLVACLDFDWRPAFRVAAVPSYKTHRVAPQGGETVPDLLTPQVPVIEAVLDAIGLARVGVAGFEADDVIGAIAVRDRGPVEVVTGDRDLFQLVDDAKPVSIVYIGKGVRNAEVVDEADVTRRYGIPGRAYADFAVLRGDPSDGLPGVPGVGDKTAAALISRWGSLDALLAALDAGGDDGFPAGAKAKLAAARDYLVHAPAVVRAAFDLPLPRYDDGIPAAPAHADALIELADRWGLDSSLNRLLSALRAVTGG
ncbi:MAG: hypothetical protein QOJ92_312 [Frankiales bacterium]|nr:hypothetical protein [Frankiales bacterium]